MIDGFRPTFTIYIYIIYDTKGHYLFIVQYEIIFRDDVHLRQSESIVRMF